jgi:gas vesicle protein
MADRSTKRFALSTLIAAIVGFVAGILTAPKSGKETRQDISEAAGKTKAEAERTLKQLHSELSQLLDQGKEKAGGLKSKAKEDLEAAMGKGNEAKEKVRGLLSALHDGGAEDQDLQKAVKEVNKAIDHLKTYLAKNEKAKKTR